MYIVWTPSQIDAELNKLREMERDVRVMDDLHSTRSAISGLHMAIGGLTEYRRWLCQQGRGESVKTDSTGFGVTPTEIKPA